MRKANAFSNQTWVCQDQKSSRPKGYFFGDSPLNFPTPILHVQLSISALLTAFFQLILNPLGQTAFISQMLVGIILGPSVLGSGNAFADIVFVASYIYYFYISETYALFGVMLFVFLVGVKMDISLVKQSGRKAVVIGLSAFFVPLILNIGFALVLRKTVAMEASLHKSIIIIAVFQCLSSFHVISCLLADLNLLNSEIGRLAVSSSIVSGVLSLIWVGLAFTIRQSKISKKDLSLPFMGLSLFCMFILIVYILRPMMLWMVAQLTDKEKSVKESYIFSIFIMITVCSLLGEVMGQHCILGPMILGLAVPDGPPLGSALVEKLDSYVSLILLPSYFVVTGARINFSMIKMKTVWILELLVMSSFCGKLMGAFGTRTGRDGTERDGTGRNEGVIFEKDMGYICLKMVKHCVPQTWNKPVPGGRGGTQKHPKSVPWNNSFHPFLAHQTRDGTPRSVPSRPVPRTKRTL
ncbi:unnamed protein product [Malus baccata var. baccata]